MATVEFKIKRSGDGETAIRNEERRTLVFVIEALGADAPGIDYDTLYWQGPFQLGSFYAWNSTSLQLPCVRISITPAEVGPGVWKGMAAYEFTSLSYDKSLQDPFNANPLNRTPKWGTRQGKRLVDMWKDFAGTPILNSSLMPYISMPKRELPVLVITMTRNQSYFSAAGTMAYACRVNNQMFWGYSNGTVKCESIVGAKCWEQYINTSDGGPINGYWEVTYEFHWDPLGWDRPILDYGIPKFNAAGQGGSLNQPAKPNPVLCPPRTAEGIPILIPVPLDGNGKALADSAIREGQLVYNTYQTIDQADFNELNLPYPS
jgi:hypothetical protein